MRVFADANILFSAADPSSATRILLDVLFHHATVVVNEHVWDEARRNLAMKRSGLAGNLEKLKSRFQFSSQMEAVSSCPLPDDDQPVLGGAVAARCSHLWTGDKRHFGHLYGKTINGTLVVSATALADELIRKGWITRC
ncbi:MAG: PIN domain-containing protein [bacterium]